MVLGGLVAGFGGRTACARADTATPLADPPITLRIAYLKGTTDLTLAKAHGSLERELGPRGVTIVWAGPFPAAAPAVEALNAGAVDLTGGSSTSFIMSRAAGVRLMLFAYQRMTPESEGILVPRASPLRAIGDLTGRRVAVNRGGSGEYILVRALAKAGVPLDAVTRVYLGPVDAATAFSSGAVDAWAIWDPFLSFTLASGEARVLADGAASGSENAIAFYVSEDFARAHRPVVEAVLRVLEAENEWARRHPREAGGVWVRELGLPEPLAARLGANNTAPIGPVGPNEAEQLERVADWYRDSHIVPVRPEVKPFLLDLRPPSADQKSPSGAAR